MIGWYGTAMLCYVTPKEHLGLPEQGRRQGRHHRLQDRRARRRSRQGPPGRADPRQRAVEGALRVPLGRPVQPRPRSGQGARVPRRDAAAGRRQARALLLDVRAALLLDEDHAGRARLRRHSRAWPRAGARKRHGGEGHRIRSRVPRSTARRSSTSMLGRERGRMQRILIAAMMMFAVSGARARAGA